MIFYKKETEKKIELVARPVSRVVDVDKGGLNLLQGKRISVVRPITIAFDILQNLTFEWRFTLMT